MIMSCFIRLLLAGEHAPRDSACWLSEASGYVGKAHAASSYGWHLGAEGSLQPTASKELGPSVLQLQENEFCQQPK